MSIPLSYGYGGWIPERTTTGETSSAVRLVGWMAAASVAFAAIGTGGELSIEHLQRGARQVLHLAPGAEIEEVGPVRTSCENLSRIREVLNPPVSELAITLGVSRQTVYNWLKGDPVADENAAKLQDLAQVADVLAYEGVAVNAALLKRKFASGRTLMQVVQAGESARDAALLLVQIHKREIAQRDRMNARFARRASTPASPDFDLPVSNHDV